MCVINWGKWHTWKVDNVDNCSFMFLVGFAKIVCSF